MQRLQKLFLTGRTSETTENYGTSACIGGRQKSVCRSSACPTGRFVRNGKVT